LHSIVSEPLKKTPDSWKWIEPKSIEKTYHMVPTIIETTIKEPSAMATSTPSNDTQDNQKDSTDLSSSSDSNPSADKNSKSDLNEKTRGAA
jgi:hypothetical protein